MDEGAVTADLMPLLPHPPSATAGDLLCFCSKRSTRTSRQEAVRRALLEGMGGVIYISREAFSVLSPSADWVLNI